VSAATTLKRAFEEMEPAFEAANPGVDVVFNFGASGVLQKQIEAGAPCDVFASASPKQVDALVSGGYVSAEDTATFCGNEVAIVVPAGNPAGVSGPQDLAGLDRLTTGNPETAPHGTKAKEWLTNLGLWDSLAPKLVFAENAAQTLDYVSRGEVDAGLVFASEATSQSSVEIAYTAPASELTSPIRYVMAPTVSTSDSSTASAFVAYVLSADGQATLAKWGFVPVTDTK
jgi:molybdate transport system substrate-binding protein